jgi:hypothetical protein
VGIAVALWPEPALAVESRATSPLSGIVRAGGTAVPNATLLVRFVASGADAVVEMLKTDIDGTFVIPNAAEGMYTVLSLVPGFQPALARILHGVRSDSVSFVPIDLEKPASVLPTSPLGKADPWIARAITPGDVLRDVPAIMAALEGGSASPGAGLAGMNASSASRAVAIPMKASVSTTAGFGAAGEGNVTKTAVDLSGAASDTLRWGFGGQYSRAESAEGARTADASHFAVDLAAGASQTLHVSSRHQSLPLDEAEASRFSAHSVDWSGDTSSTSHASVSARLVTQSRFYQTGPVADLFARESQALDVLARYRTDWGASSYARMSVGYRSATSGLTSFVPAAERETRVGGAAGVRLLDTLVVEGGATGDFSVRSRGVTPEITLALEKNGWRLYGFASRRYERQILDETVPGLVGNDEADLTRVSRSLYRGGLRYESRDGEGFSVEASRRELSGTYRYLLDPDFFDRLDSLYFLTGDIATEVASSATMHVVSGIDSRYSCRAGQIVGARDGSVQKDEASYAVAEAALRINATRTSIGVGYRVVSQTLSRGSTNLRNDVEAVDFSLAQTLPIPLLQALGSEWRALLSLELGKRREGEDVARANRRLAGGLALSF